MKKDSIKENTFRTTDLGLASALFAKQLELHNVDKSNPKRVKFTFDSNGNENAEELAKKYWNDELEVKAKKLFDSTRTLKNIIHGN